MPASTPALTLGSISSYNAASPPNGGFFSVRVPVTMVAFNVAQLLKANVGSTRQYEFEEVEPMLEQSAGVRGSVRGRVHLLRTGRGILVQLEYGAWVELVCGRCLDPFVQELDGSVEEEFLPVIDLRTGEPLPVEADEPHLTEQHVLDLTDTIRQDLIVRTPMRPLCSESCPGLCPECGAARRLGACQCEPARQESPFANLARLLGRDDGGGAESQ